MPGGLAATPTSLCLLPCCPAALLTCSPPAPPPNKPTDDQVNIIEKAKTDRNDKPLEDIKIASITLLESVEEQ